jgi:hypothetical protein
LFAPDQNGFVQVRASPLVVFGVGVVVVVVVVVAAAAAAAIYCQRLRFNTRLFCWLCVSWRAHLSWRILFDSIFADWLP